MNSNPPHPSELRIGWSETDITPPRLPVLIAGQFHARLSEGVRSPLKATVCALDNGQDQSIFVCCDLVSISDQLATQTRDYLKQSLTEVLPDKVIFNATHSHTAPDYRAPFSTASGTPGISEFPNTFPIDFPLGMSANEYTDWVAQQLFEAIQKAWSHRASGGIAYGMDYAVVARNRRWADHNGKSYMYNLAQPEHKEIFRHIEGYEDHSLNLLATYDSQQQLTGIIVNIPCPSQQEEHSFLISADFWHETRAELRKRFGAKLFILPQVSTAGDLTSRLIFETEAQERMLKLRNLDPLQNIALKISDAVSRILPAIAPTIDNAPTLQHQVQTVDLPANNLTAKDVEDCQEAARQLQKEYEAELRKLEENPELKQQERWYVPLTRAWRRMRWNLAVVDRYEHQKTHPNSPIEVHVVRLGDIAFASNPFEYYLDFGIQIKVRSPAIQTFLIQLAGQGTYLPSPRSVLGGGYGSLPASNRIGPEGGQVLADHTVNTLRTLFV